MEKIRVLFLAASPDVSPLSPDKEHREITAKIRAAEYRDSLDVLSRWAVRPDDLQQALLEHQPHVLHFSGRGTTSEESVFLDNNGNPQARFKRGTCGLALRSKRQLAIGRPKRVLFAASSGSHHPGQQCLKPLASEIGVLRGTASDRLRANSEIRPH